MNKYSRKSQRKNCLSVIVPCFNEEDFIYKVLMKVVNQDVVREVIVIDDGSTDKTSEKIKKIKSNKLILIKNERNLGKGASIAKGLKMATSEIIGIQDADLEYDPLEYKRLVQPIIDNRADVVYGSRFLTFDGRRAHLYWHRIGNKLLTTLSNIATNIDLTDMETCYKFIRRDFANKLEIKEKRFGIEPEITIKLARMRARFYEVPISYNGRGYKEGKKITWRDGFSALRCIVIYSFKKYSNELD